MADTFLHPKGNISAKKGTNLKVRIDFDELRFKKEGENYNVWMYAFSCDAYAYEDKQTKEKAEVPGKVFISLSKGDDKPGQTAVIKALEGLHEAKTYSGFISIDDSISIYGKAATNDALWESVKDEIASLVEVEEPKKLADDDLKAPKSNRGGGFRGGESAYDAATGRAKAVKELAGDADFKETAAALEVSVLDLLKVVVK